ncbi:MAG: BamA/TamA family outer membrane protein [Planctomycetota bacterium]
MRPFATPFALLLLALPHPAWQTERADAPAGQEAQPRRPLVKAVRVSGNRRYTAEQIEKAFGQAPGAILLDKLEIKRGLDVLFRTFHVRATIEYLPAADVPDGPIELLITVEELPRDLELRIVGNVEIDDEKVREWAGVGEREELYLYQAPRIRQRLEQRYREEGYHFVKVEVVERPAGTDPLTGEPSAPDVIFEIQEGPEVKVAEVVLRGNEHLPDGGVLFFKHGLSKLAKAELRGPRIFNWFAKDFVPETLDADIVAMRQVYRDLGYLDAVVELEKLEFSDDREWVTPHIRVEEGPLFEVETLAIRAVKLVRDESVERGYREEPGELLIPEAELLARLDLAPGRPFEQRLVQEDRRRLREAFGEKGHIEHDSLPAWEGFRFLEPELVYSASRPAVKVTYRVAQGEPITLGEIRLAGNLHTQDRVLRRLMTIEPGQLANPKEIERSRTRIEATDFFSPDVFHPDIIPPRYEYRDTGDPGVKDLEFLVEEGGVLRFEISGGISTTNGAFGTIRLSKGNFDLTNLPSSFGDSIGEVARLESFHGAGQNLTLNASPGTELTRYSISFFDPDVFKMQEDYVGLGLLASNSRRRLESHVEERREYGLRLVKQVTADASVFARYAVGSIDVSDIFTGNEASLSDPLAVPADLKAQEGENDLAHLDFGYDFNTVDSRLLPRNGIEVNLQANLYDEVLGSDFDFARTTLQFDVYDEFDEDPDVVSDYVHFGFQVGAGLAYGQSDEIPYTERTFFGGRQLRGFDYRGIGPNENDFPIGGTTSFYATFEYRHPLVKNVQPGSYREIEAIQGGLFLDLGVLDPDEFSLDFDELRISTGFLFGISFPVPLTFSFGFPLREGDGDDLQVFEFEIGF